MILDNKEKTISECLTELRNLTNAMDPNSNLRHRLEEIIEALNDPQLITDKNANLLEFRVDELITTLEIEHPRITNILNDLMVTLTGIGI